MKLRGFLAGFVAMVGMVSASPALADISALYEFPSDNEYPSDFRMTVEVNDSGDARIHVMGRGSYLLVKDGSVHVITRGIDGLYAETFADLDAALKSRGELGGISFEFFEEMGGSEITEVGKHTVGIWSGQGYKVENYSLGSGEGPDLAISPDERLAPIGKAIRQSFGSRYGIARTISLAAVPLSIKLFDTNVAEIFATGTPIKLGLLELATVSEEPIDQSRFELPKRVLSKEEIAKYLQPFEQAPAFKKPGSD